MLRTKFSSHFVQLSFLAQLRTYHGDLNISSRLIVFTWNQWGPDGKARAQQPKLSPIPCPKSYFSSNLPFSSQEARALLSGSNLLLVAEPPQADLLNRACFGVPITTSENDKQWSQLAMEEAFYLSHSLKCLHILGKGKSLMTPHQQLWQHMKSQKPNFPDLYKAYSHLRVRNWIVMSGVRYGVDFVAYRHHPALVHSEFTVLVLSGGNYHRLRVWSDVHCTARLCGGVVKTLLVLEIDKNGHDVGSPSCLDEYSVGEYTISRWLPERCREDNHTVVESKKKKK